jgi:uncharacterized protein (DUF885 family)
MRFIAAVACAALLAGPAFADPSADFARLIEEYEELRAERDVNRRAAQGDLEAAAQWPDRSREAVEEWDAAMADFHGRLQEIDSEALDANEQASYAVLDHILGQSVALPGTVTARFPFTNDSGFHTSPAFYAMSARVRAVPEAEAYIARLNALPGSFADQRAWLEEAIEEGWTQPRYIMDGVLDQIRAQIVDDATESELYQPLANLPSTIDEAERQRLRAEGLTAINEAVLPAFRDLLEFFEAEYVPASRDSIGISEVPGGREYYRALVRFHTTLDLTPEEVHQTGVEEVGRIRAEMDEAIAETGFEGSFEEFVEYLRTDERFYAQTEEELLMRASYLSKLADDQMPAFFNRLPRLSYGVRPVPANIAPNYTTGRYWAGDADTGRCAHVRAPGSGRGSPTGNWPRRPQPGGFRHRKESTMADPIVVAGPVSGTETRQCLETGKFGVQSQGAVVARQRTERGPALPPPGVRHRDRLGLREADAVSDGGR